MKSKDQILLRLKAYLDTYNNYVANTGDKLDEIETLSSRIKALNTCRLFTGGEAVLERAVLNSQAKYYDSCGLHKDAHQTYVKIEEFDWVLAQ